MASHGHFHWNELLARDVERAKRFYAETIGWTSCRCPRTTATSIGWRGSATSRSPASSRSTGRDSRTCRNAGCPIIAVDDVDARVEKAIAAGAKLMRPIFDVHGVGRIAILTEPGGAGVGWITPVQ